MQLINTNLTLRTTTKSILICLALLIVPTLQIELLSKQQYYFKGKYRPTNGKEDQEEISARIQLYLSQGQDNQPVYNMKTILFYEDSLFSKGLFIESNLHYDSESKTLQVTDKSRIYENQVGIQNSPQFSTYQNINFKIIGTVQFDSEQSIDQFINLKFNISSLAKFNNRKIDFELKFTKKVDLRYQQLFFFIFLGVMMVSQLLGFAFMCHYKLTSKKSFIRKIPIIPSLQACLMDLLIVLICLNYFDIYSYLWKAQLIWLILKLPMLINYYKEPLFPAKIKRRRSSSSSPRNSNHAQHHHTHHNHTHHAHSLQNPVPKKKKYVNKLPENPWSLLFFLTFITITSNIVLYVISPQEISYVTLMLLLTVILENFAFNKRPQTMWYFWSFMVPKSLIVFYIVYYPDNLIGAPINTFGFFKDICLGVIGLALIILQRVLKPRFLGKERSSKGWINGMDIFYIRPSQHNSSSHHNNTLHKDLLSTPSTQITVNINGEAQTEDHQLQCGICWEEFGALETKKSKGLWRKMKNLFFKGRRPVRTRCGHDFHLECLESWVIRKNECPMCRNTIRRKN